MRQVIHEFSWEQVLASVIKEHSEDFEDGFWQLGLKSEYIGLYLPPTTEGQVKGTFPSNIHRMLGIVLTRVDNWFPSTIKIENGVIHYDPDRDSSGLIESGEGVGEDSNSAGENIS